MVFWFLLCYTIPIFFRKTNSNSGFVREEVMSSMMFSVVPFIVTIGFILVFGMIIFSMISGARQWSKNNNSPVLTVEAVVVTKRIDVSHSSNVNANHHMSSSSHTRYFATFEVESGSRMEFAMNGTEYGMIVEGDHGKLTFQGTRYLSFTR